MSPIQQALAGRSARASPASASVSAPTADPPPQLDRFADFKIKTEQAIKDLQDLTEGQGKKLGGQGRLLVKYQRLEIRILKEDGRKAICKLLKADYEMAKQKLGKLSAIIVTGRQSYVAAERIFTASHPCHTV